MAQSAARQLTLEHVERERCLCGAQLYRDSRFHGDLVFRGARYACFMCGRDIYLNAEPEVDEVKVA